MADDLDRADRAREPRALGALGAEPAEPGTARRKIGREAGERSERCTSRVHEILDLVAYVLSGGDATKDMFKK